MSHLYCSSTFILYFYINSNSFGNQEKGEYLQSGMNNDRLENEWGLSSKGQILFCQKWAELFHPNTIDSYRFRTRNLHSLLVELLESVKHFREHSEGFANIKSLIEEGRESAEFDYSLKKHNMPLYGRMLAILKIPKQDQTHELIKLEYHLKFVLRELENKYLNWILADLEESVTLDDYNRINELSGVLATELLYLGWSPRGLLKLMEQEFKPSRYSFDHKWRNFNSTICSERQPFYCYFPWSDNIPKSILRMIGINVLEGAALWRKHPKSGCGNYIKQDGVYIELEVEAFSGDIEEAIEKAKEIYLSQCSLLSYYHYEISEIDTAVVVHSQGLRSRSVELKKLWHVISLQSNGRYSNLEYVVPLLTTNTLEETSRQRLANVFRQYRLASTSVETELAFTNRWIAIESLMVTGRHSSIIEHVKILLPSILCTRYVYRLLKNFMYDCQRCGVSVKSKDRELNLKNPSLIDVEAVLNLFKTENDYQDLLRACSVNKLLFLRCESLLKSFKDGKAVKIMLEAHHRRVSQQVQRIYRVRNSIVHSAKVEKDLMNLTINMEYYLNAVISEVVFKLSQESYSDLNELFTHLEENYQATLGFLERERNYDTQMVIKGPLFM
ncbi:hypothetical protein QWJ34_00185 [Saccharibacillus sp. CPCC 101409]|uniref:hypothetical protein n=1 Tax=Saccharibacillus sp. CPCC 101409 TaxID=3058041 RepID=UPI0026724CC5|nr:hypothetical protein [Saccharibacillus sp. CPCC 101409]MDO3408174.1 hypothetical protein [Saccharibacillus sp. CPCC 101409]